VAILDCQRASKRLNVASTFKGDARNKENEGKTEIHLSAIAIHGFSRG
jgi:hypothetical protein